MWRILLLLFFAHGLLAQPTAINPTALLRSGNVGEVMRVAVGGKANWETMASLGADLGLSRPVGEVVYGTGTGVGSNAAFVNKNGKVGINKANPAFSLDVQGAIYGQTILDLHNGYDVIGGHTAVFSGGWGIVNQNTKGKIRPSKATSPAIMEWTLDAKSQSLICQGQLVLILGGWWYPSDIGNFSAKVEVYNNTTATWIKILDKNFAPSIDFGAFETTPIPYACPSPYTKIRFNIYSVINYATVGYIQLIQQFNNDDWYAAENSAKHVFCKDILSEDLMNAPFVKGDASGLLIPGAGLNTSNAFSGNGFSTPLALATPYLPLTSTTSQTLNYASNTLNINGQINLTNLTTRLKAEGGEGEHGYDDGAGVRNGLVFSDGNVHIRSTNGTNQSGMGVFTNGLPNVYYPGSTTANEGDALVLTNAASGEIKFGKTKKKISYPPITSTITITDEDVVLFKGANGNFNFGSTIYNLPNTLDFCGRTVSFINDWGYNNSSSYMKANSTLSNIENVQGGGFTNSLNINFKAKLVCTCASGAVYWMQE